MESCLCNDHLIPTELLLCWWSLSDLNNDVVYLRNASVVLQALTSSLFPSVYSLPPCSHAARISFSSISSSYSWFPSLVFSFSPVVPHSCLYSSPSPSPTSFFTQFCPLHTFVAVSSSCFFFSLTLFHSFSTCSLFSFPSHSFPSFFSSLCLSLVSLSSSGHFSWLLFNPSLLFPFSVFRFTLGVHHLFFYLLFLFSVLPHLQFSKFLSCHSSISYSLSLKFFNLTFISLHIQ